MWSSRRSQGNSILKTLKALSIVCWVTLPSEEQSRTIGANRLSTVIPDRQSKLVALTESIVARCNRRGRPKTVTSAGPVNLRWSMESYTGHGCLAILVTFGDGVTKLMHAMALELFQDSLIYLVILG